MQFLVDAQLPPALARWLVAQGYIAEHVSDVELGAASDLVIWRWAENNRATILTKDEDFAIWRAEGVSVYPIVIWLRLGNTRRRELLRWFEVMLPQINERLASGETLIEIQ